MKKKRKKKPSPEELEFRARWEAQSRRVRERILRQLEESQAREEAEAKEG